MKITFDNDEERETFLIYLKKQAEFERLCEMTGYGQADNTKDFLRFIIKALREHLLASTGE